MRILILSIFYCFLGSFSISAQEKYDYQWMAGYPPYGGDTSLFGACMLDFNGDSLKLVKIPQATLVTIGSTASICDKNGKLILYSNGCQINNGNYKLVKGCENINPGMAWDDYCTVEGAEYYPTRQSQIILPIPEKDNQYIYLAHRKEYGGKYSWESTNYFTEFYHCNIIDMTLENGQGKSIDNFNIEYPDIVQSYNLAACKHTNGKDWWIINFSFNTKKFYRVLLTKDGVSGPWEQEGGPPRDSINSLGQAVFSPDGKKYACIYSSLGKAWLMDFDRKTGLLSNLKILDYELKPGWNLRGLSFSPNSKYLYISADYYLYQFDTEAKDVEQSKIVVAENDGYKLPDWPYLISFADQQLGPDGKIYIGQYIGAVRQWSVINKPNEPGLACDVKAHSVLFPVFSTPNVPIQPNFRLGPDTSTSVNTIPTYRVEMKSWYIPSSKIIKCWIQHLPCENDIYTVTVNDITGRALKSQKISNPQYQEDISLDGSSLVPGVYIVNLMDHGRVFVSGKVMVY